jgi:hypothetical protein
MLRRVLKLEWCVAEAFPKRNLPNCWLRQILLLLYKGTPIEMSRDVNGLGIQIASSEVINRGGVAKGKELAGARTLVLGDQPNS